MDWRAWVMLFALGWYGQATQRPAPQPTAIVAGAPETANQARDIPSIKGGDAPYDQDGVPVEDCSGALGCTNDTH